jgi:hypothetical protein
MDFIKRHIDLASTLTLIITVVLFVIALFEKGFTHELLLEAGVFLISIKLVLSSFRTQQRLHSIEEKLERLLDNK